MSKKEANETKEPAREITVEQAQEIIKEAEEKHAQSFLAEIDAVCRKYGLTLEPVTHIRVKKV